MGTAQHLGGMALGMCRRLCTQALRPARAARAAASAASAAGGGRVAGGAVLAAGSAAAFLAAAALERRRTALACETQKVKLNPGEELILAADCGGTTTRLMMYAVDPNEPIIRNQAAPGRLVFIEKYPNILFSSFDAIIETFFADADKSLGATLPRPRAGVLAVAGVVTGGQVRFTNLDWTVNARQLEEKFNIGSVEIINDFVAQGYGVLTLGKDDVFTLQEAPPREGAPIVVVGAGTGLGTTFLTVGPGGDYDAYPSEGGHIEFPPRGKGSSELQIDLLKHLKIKLSGYTRVSTERVVSGQGLCNVYEFLAYKYPERVDEGVQAAFNARRTDASVITKNCVPGSLCEETMQIFASCYGCYTGTVGIMFMPFQGIYLTGGVTQKLQDWLIKDGSFINAYHDKGRVAPMLSNIPLYVVKCDDMGQRGAHLKSARLLKDLHAGRVGKSSAEPGNVDVPPRNVDAELKDVSNLISKFKEGHKK